MLNTDNIKVLAFDADDTLWDNQTHYDNAGDRLCEILAPYGDKEYIEGELFRTECANMADLGFGGKAFTISMVETALRVSDGKVSAHDIWKILEAGKEVLTMAMLPFPDVEATLGKIRESGKYRMVLLTKGELLPQQNKVQRSGLAGYFDEVKIVADKTPDVYAELYREFGITPEEFLMVGNSMKSDIIPVLETGGYGIYIPFHRTWKMEHAEEVEHGNMTRVEKFGDLADILL